MSDNQKLSAVLSNGRAAFLSKNLIKALQIGIEATKEFPEEARSWHFLGVVYRTYGDAKAAKSCTEKAVRFDPEGIEFHLDHTRSLLMLGERQEALASARRAMAIETRSAPLINAIGVLCSECELHKDAERFFRRAVGTAQNSDYYYNLAAAQRMIGDFENAEKSADEAIKLEPLACRAYFLRSNLRKQTPENNHLSELEHLIANASINWRGRTLLHYAAAKELEDLKAFGKAFVHLKKAGQLKRDNTRYNVDGDIETINAIIETFDRKLPTQGFESRAPIFVFGLPRTGTTLVERIIGSHSEVVSQGELATLSVEIQNLAKQLPVTPKNKLELVRGSASINFQALGQNYVQKGFVPDGIHSRFIDKMPLNYLYAGLIHAALPNAKMVLLKRHPMDACYAIFKMNFEGVYPFSYVLEDLGKYYLAYRKLVEHWKSVLGDAILEVDYENLVANQEAQTKRIIEYCDLPWEDACLNFHENKAASTTASAVQVRKPIYNSSIGLWRNLEAELAPLAEYLRENGVEI